MRSPFDGTFASLYVAMSHCEERRTTEHGLRRRRWQRATATAATRARLLFHLLHATIQLLAQRQKLRALHRREKSSQLLLFGLEQVGTAMLRLYQARHVVLHLRLIRLGRGV